MSQQKLVKSKKEMVYIRYLPETVSSCLYQEEHFDLEEEIHQSELGSLVASGFFAFFVFVFAGCTDTSGRVG